MTNSTESKVGRRRASSWFLPAILLAMGLATGLAGLVSRSGTERNAAILSDLDETPVEGGVFRFPLMGAFRTLDPAKVQTDVEIILVQQLFDGLTAFDDQLNVVPSLAQYWEISDEGRTYTFELRDDALFHNSRPVTAEDCVFSFERLLTKGLNDTNYQYYSRIEGAQAFRDGKAPHVAGLKAIDERTFQIRFTTPFVPALSVLSMYSSKILPKQEMLTRGDGFFDSPIGSGPFQFSRWIERDEDPTIPFVAGLSQGVRFEANPAYFGGRPYLDAVAFRHAANDESAGRGVPLRDRADCFETDEDVDDWVPMESHRLLALKYMVLPTHVAPFNNPKIRRALNLALDKRSFLDLHAVTRGISPATGIIPPGIPGFMPVQTAYHHDLQEARRLLAEAGYPEGKGLPPLEIPALSDGRGSRAAKERRGCLTACLYKLGVIINEVPVDRIIEAGEAEFSTRPMLYAGTWYADFPDADNFLRPLFHSQGAVNVTGYSNAKVDALLEEVLSVTSYSRRNKIYREIERLILEDSPIIPTDYGRLRYVVRPNVRGFKVPSLGTAYINLRRVWLEEDSEEPEVEL